MRSTISFHIFCSSWAELLTVYCYSTIALHIVLHVYSTNKCSSTYRRAPKSPDKLSLTLQRSLTGILEVMIWNMGTSSVFWVVVAILKFGGSCWVGSQSKQKQAGVDHWNIESWTVIDSKVNLLLQEFGGGGGAHWWLLPAKQGRVRSSNSGRPNPLPDASWYCCHHTTIALQSLLLQEKNICIHCCSAEMKLLCHKFTRIFLFLHDFLFPRQWRLRVKYLFWVVDVFTQLCPQLYSKVGGQKDQSILRKFSPPRARCGAISYKITKMLTKRSWIWEQRTFPQGFPMSHCKVLDWRPNCTGRD